MAARSVSNPTRAVGLCLLLGSLFLAGRLVWEMTFLTWREGPQSIGFSVAHTMPELLVLGTLASLGAAAWCIGLGVAAIVRFRSLARLDWVLLIAIMATVGSQFVPYAAWQWVTLQVLGFPKHHSPAWLAMYGTLTEAARAGDTARADLLLSRGLDVDGLDRARETALHAASSCGRSQTVTDLLRRGARLNLDNAEGETALDAGAKEGHLETVKLLIAAGADPTIKTDGGRGFTAADLAWLSENTDVAKYLDGRTGP